jgi:hypothetical protein
LKKEEEIDSLEIDALLSLSGRPLGRFLNDDGLDVEEGRGEKNIVEDNESSHGYVDENERGENERGSY